MIKLQYDYYDGILADGESQYSAHAVDTRQEVFAVNAIYVQSASEAYRGNPFIEALPPIRNRKAMVEDYYEMLPKPKSSGSPSDTSASKEPFSLSMLVTLWGT